MESKTSSNQPTQREIESLMNKKPNLSRQSFSDISQLTSISPQVMSRQATINIGTIGHVAHGKSKLVQSITGTSTIRFRDEAARNITIKLGYANAKIFKCPKCPPPFCYKSFSSDKEDHPECMNLGCEAQMDLIRHISFVDCPGHKVLMATMLTGASIMDSALLLIASNMPCPQPQTKEHLAAIEPLNLDKVVIVQNKIDLTLKEEGMADRNYAEIKEFVRGTKAQDSPIIPISAQFGYNVDVLLQYLCEYIPVPKRNLEAPLRMLCIRSFDVNKPGESFEKLKGGVAGGTILTGVLKLGDDIEIRPGLIKQDKEGKLSYKPIVTKVTSLMAEQNELLYAIPGGLIGVGLNIDPSFAKSNNLVGNTIGTPGQMPEVYSHVELEFELMKKILGCDEVKDDTVDKLRVNEIVLLHLGVNTAQGKVMDVKNNVAKIKLIGGLICAELGEKATISRKVTNKWRFIGCGKFTKGKKADKIED